jgi:hypothetical protein
MKMHHGIVLAVILPSFAGSLPPAVARGSQSSNDTPWNSEHISRLRDALTDLCHDRNRARELGAVAHNQA